MWTAQKGQTLLAQTINMIEGIMFASSASYIIISYNSITKFILFSWNLLAILEAHESNIWPYNYGRI